VRWLVSPSDSVKGKRPLSQSASHSNSFSVMPSSSSSSLPIRPSTFALDLHSRPLNQLSQRLDRYGTPSHSKKSLKRKAKSATGSVVMTSVIEEDESDLDGLQRKASTRSVLRNNSVSSQSSHQTSLKPKPSSKSHRKAPSLSPLPTPYSPSSTFTAYTNSQALPSNGTPGFTSLILPRAPPPSSMSGKVSDTSILTSASGKVDLTRSGLAQTTMASVEVCRGVASQVGNSLSKRTGSIRMKLGLSHNSPPKSPDTFSEGALGFMGYRSPPSFVPGGSVLVQVWAVGLDATDARVVNFKLGERPLSSATRSRASSSPGSPSSSTLWLRSAQSRSSSPESNWGSKTENGVRNGKKKYKQKAEVGFIPGRSFVGRVVECGWEVKETEGGKRGQWVVGLVDLKKVPVPCMLVFH
jgi:hypothetical protein